MGNRIKKPCSPNFPGYTLIELIMAMVLIGVLSSLLLPNLNFNTTTDSPARTLAQAVRFAQSMSFSVGGQYRIKRHDTNSSQYQVFDPDGNQNFLAETSDGSAIDSFDITFDGLGRPTDSSGAMLGSLDIKLVTPAANPADSSPLIGTVHIEKNTGAAWAVFP
ncbi:MAG: prepilin-type N-terminal cleavage/methylation domain-containing protein [Magnetococcales bacterium]|nr:prepilin-type N-terminal cleavage/methylation domain-containing protein [Magnetococcales bacterium]